MQSLDRHLWRSWTTNNTKLHLYRVFILPIMLYGSECWAVNKADIRRIDAVDQWCLRRILDIRWHDTHTHPFYGPFSGTTRVSRYQKGKPIWILLKQETVSSSGISWAICKSAPCSRQVTTPAPHHSVFYRPDALPAANQQRQSNEGHWHAGTTLSEMPSSVALLTSHHFHPSLSPVVSVSLGILHEWMRTQMLAKPSF